MKPWYRQQDEFYLLACVIKEGSKFEQPCKALINPGESPTVTRATGEFLRRCGWLASNAALSEEGREIATADSPDSSIGTAQVIHCKLVVGSCQLSTVLHVMEDVDFSDQCVLSRWHIHIGSKDWGVLQYNGWDTDTCCLSANHHELCRYGSPPNCPLNCESFTAALSNGHPECLSHWHTVKFMNTINFMHNREGRVSNSDPGPYYCNEAASMPSAEVLLYLHDVVGIPWDASTCAAAARAGSIDCLSYAHASGCPWDSMTCAAVAGAGSIDCLSYAHASECPWDASTCAAAARAGSMDCLSYAHASGCPWDSMTCASAAAHGNLVCLAYAHEKGCELDTIVLHQAARNGQLECLKYAHTHGCPYSAVLPYSLSKPPGPPMHLTTQAVHGSSIPCLAYVREAMGCVWDAEGSECKMAFQRGDLLLLRYIHEHGGVFCTDFGWLCPDRRTWLNAVGPDTRTWLNAVGVDAERKANCLLYVYSYGGCIVENVWQTRVGSLAVELLKARRIAVQLSFHTAGRSHFQGPVIAAVHAVMQRMPSEVLQEIIYTARL